MDVEFAPQHLVGEGEILASQTALLMRRWNSVLCSAAILRGPHTRQRDDFSFPVATSWHTSHKSNKPPHSVLPQIWKNPVCQGGGEAGYKGKALSSKGCMGVLAFLSFCLFLPSYSSMLAQELVLSH